MSIRFSIRGDHFVQNHRSSSWRSGATIIEVMFAIGILLFGLLGIAAFIPAASKLARNSIDLNRGASIGQSVAQEFNARGFGITSRWLSYLDDGTTPVDVRFPRSTNPFPPAVSIDPLFVSRLENFVPPSEVVGIGTGLYDQFDRGTSNFFRRNLFPYYDNFYNPLLDPRLPSTAANSLAVATPRLLRVAIEPLGSTRASGTVASEFPAPLASGHMVDDTDQLAFEQPQDKTLPSSQIIRPGAVAPSSVDFPFPGGRASRPEYSWIATIQPQSATLGTLSVAVIRGRDRTFETPIDGTNPIADPTDPLELSERLALVSSATGFRGGAGGTVVLQWTTAVSGDLNTDGWIMLIKNDNGVSRHAWYRIVQADRDPQPVGAIWERNVTLEGPDWPTDPGDTTMAVLVEGVVSVTESTVRLR